MRTVETRIYQFDELSDKAKGKARDWYRESIADWDWWDFLYDDAQEIGMEIKDFDLCRRDISG
ncbi:MAG: antitoxin of toxin-antitoxin stability system, partial [Nitrospirae bacterium CG17_big_fil_post_rev_8_21_14_2_50_50_9]